jgi:hypothetical protein
VLALDEIIGSMEVALAGMLAVQGQVEVLVGAVARAAGRGVERSGSSSGSGSGSGSSSTQAYYAAA